MSARLPPVCILTAGKGSRMGSWGEAVHKALLSVAGKPILGHLIERFPPRTRFVVGLGHRADQIRRYLADAHPRLDVQFVSVEPYAGPGSGPGRSIWCCREFLAEPFYFLPCDGLFDFDPTTMPDDNWVGVARVTAEESTAYSSVGVHDGRVTELRVKQRVAGDYRAFTGLMHVRDYETYWRSLANARPESGEPLVSTGLSELIAAGRLRAVEVAWTDLGVAERYEAFVKRETAAER